jgi:hypothetical protein
MHKSRSKMRGSTSSDGQQYTCSLIHANMHVTRCHARVLRSGSATDTGLTYSSLTSGAAAAMWAAASARWVGVHTLGGASTRYLGAGSSQQEGWRCYGARQQQDASTDITHLPRVPGHPLIPSTGPCTLANCIFDSLP